MENPHWHTFQILTKRPQRMRDVLKAGKFPTLKNVWLGIQLKIKNAWVALQHFVRLRRKSDPFPLNP